MIKSFRYLKNFTALSSKIARNKQLAGQSKSYFSNQNDDNTTHETRFGFEKVSSPEDKTKKVHEVFASVATSYDIMNDLMSGGVHRIWKDRFVTEIGGILPNIHFQEGEKYELPFKSIDVAGGTADIAFRIIEKNQNLAKRKMLDITVFDINEHMLQVGQQRAEQNGYLSKYLLNFVQGNAEDLSQFPDESFDLYTIAYGIRNVSRIDKALKEAHRVLKKGGRFMCLEFSKVNIEPLNSFYKFYSFNIIPLMGSLVAQDRQSYQYLVESIEKFYTQEEFVNQIEEAGFKSVSYINLTGGISAIHSGFKL